MLVNSWWDKKRCILSVILVVMLCVVIFICFVLSLIGYMWLLHRKNRSPLFLVFYFILAVFCLTSFIYQVTHPKSYWWDNTLPLLGFGIILIFIISWVVLILIKNL